MVKEVLRLYYSARLAQIRMFAFVALLLVCLSSCRKIDIVWQDDDFVREAIQYSGMYILCEGNMGSNRAQVDFLSYGRDTVYNNVFPAINPEVVKELGDVGNDIARYGGSLYLVINCSNKVEVTSPALARRGQINIDNCRNVCFDGGYAYITSYAGPIEADRRQRGWVAKVDTATLAIVDSCLVGYQPDGIVAYKGRLYVANTGGYLTKKDPVTGYVVPDRDSTLSVIDIAEFREIARIPVAYNLSVLCLDSARGMLYATALGDHVTIPPSTWRINLESLNSVLELSEGQTINHKPLTINRVPFTATRMCISGDALYYYSYAYGFEGVRFGAYNLSSQTDNSLELEQQDKLTVPYGIMVDEKRGYLYIANSPSYVRPGYLYMYHLDTSIPTLPLHRVFRTGDIPGHFCIKD